MQKLGVALYRRLARGSAVTREQVAAACGVSPQQVARLLDQFPPTALEFDAHGAIVAFGGLSLVPTQHRFVAAAIELHTWCVFDALFLPELLGKPATLVTHCPAS